MFYARLSSAKERPADSYRVSRTAKRDGRREYGKGRQRRDSEMTRSWEDSRHNGRNGVTRDIYYAKRKDGNVHTGRRTSIGSEQFGNDRWGRDMYV